MSRLLRLLKEIALVMPYEIVFEKIVEVLLVGRVALQIPSQDRQSLQSASVLWVMDQLLVQIVAIVLPDLVQLELPALLLLLLDLVLLSYMDATSLSTALCLYERANEELLRCEADAEAAKEQKQQHDLERQRQRERLGAVRLGPARRAGVPVRVHHGRVSVLYIFV